MLAVLFALRSPEAASSDLNFGQWRYGTRPVQRVSWAYNLFSNFSLPAVNLTLLVYDYKIRPVGRLINTTGQMSFDIGVKLDLVEFAVDRLRVSKGSTRYANTYSVG